MAKKKTAAANNAPTDNEKPSSVTINGKEYVFACASFLYKRKLIFAEVLLAEPKENEKLLKQLVADHTNNRNEFCEGILKLK